MPRIAIWSDLGILGMSAWAGVRHGDSRQRPCARRARTSVLFRFRLRHGRDHRRGLFAAMADGALDPSRAAPRSYPCLAVHGLDGGSEEHTSELQSLMRISYAVFCLKK